MSATRITIQTWNYMFWWKRDGESTVRGGQGEGSGRDVGVATILSLSALGGDKMARTASHPSSHCCHRSMRLPLPARLLQARRGPFFAKDIGAVTSMWLVAVVICRAMILCRDWLDMWHAEKRTTQQLSEYKTYTLKTPENTSLWGLYICRDGNIKTGLEK
jgi:hypothetical protein